MGNKCFFKCLFSKTNTYTLYSNPLLIKSEKVETIKNSSLAIDNCYLHSENSTFDRFGIPVAKDPLQHFCPLIYISVYFGCNSNFCALSTHGHITFRFVIRILYDWSTLLEFYLIKSGSLLKFSHTAICTMYNLIHCW